jgi:hypothetical protein
MPISAWTSRNPSSDNCGKQGGYIRDIGVLRSIGEVHSSPLFNPRVDDLLLEPFVAQWMRFIPFLIRGASINDLQLVEVRAAQYRNLGDNGQGFFHGLAFEQSANQFVVMKIGRLNEAHESPTVFFQLRRNVRIGIEVLGEFLLALVLLDLWDVPNAS